MANINLAEKCHVDIVQRLAQVREHHDQFVSHLSRIRNEQSVYNRNGPLSDAENREMANLTLSGLQLLSAWTSDVVETVRGNGGIQKGIEWI